MKQFKNSLLAISLLIFTLGTATAQKLGKATSVNSSVILMKPASEVWPVFSKIEGLEKVVPSLLSHTHIEGNGEVKEGCIRYCKAPEGNVFREKIVKLDNEGMFYAYEIIEGVPAKMTNSFRVISLGTGMSKVIWNSDYQFMENPMMKEDQFYSFVNMNGQKIVDEVKAYFSM